MSGANWFETLGVIAERLRRYLLVRTILGLVTAALYVAAPTSGSTC